MIEPERYYTTKEASQLLSLSPVVTRKKCKDWTLVCSNASETKRAQYRVKGENILLFLNK